MIFDRDNLTLIDSIDLTAAGPAIDIAFGNATTAYASIPTTNSVAVIDLTVNALVSQIPVGGSPMGIEAVGNQVCAAVQDIDTAVIIDTRTNRVEASIKINAPSPTYVIGDPDNDLFGVVALGAGKLEEDDEDPTSPFMVFISIPSRAEIGAVELSSRANEAPQQMPMGAVANNSQFSFVPVQNGLLLINTRSRNRAAAIQFEAYDQIYYHGSRAEIVTVKPDGRSIDVFNEVADTKKLSVALPDSINALVGIAP